MIVASDFFFEGTTYWSQGDEDAHFAWLARIPGVRNVRGVGTRIFLDLDLGRITADDLRELQAVYRRYKGDLSQLSTLEASIG